MFWQLCSVQEKYYDLIKTILILVVQYKFYCFYLKMIYELQAFYNHYQIIKY